MTTAAPTTATLTTATATTAIPPGSPSGGGGSAGSSPRSTGPLVLVQAKSYDLDADSPTWGESSAPTAQSDIGGAGGKLIDLDFRTEWAPAAGTGEDLASCRRTGYRTTSTAFGHPGLTPMRAFCIRTTDHHCALVQVRRAGETADLLVRTWKDDCV